MALPLRPSNPNTPIPNNPFYSPESNYISGVSGPFIVGSGLSVNNITGVISASGGGGGAVSSVLAASGISVTPGSGTGNVTVSNTGVLSLTAGSGISLSAATGNITISSTSGATVSNVVGTAPISVANGTTTPNVSVATATTTNSGVTTLVNNLTTNDNTKALTAAQGKLLQDQINSLVVSGTIELAGTINAATGLILSVTSVGVSDGYAVGSTLPLPTSTTNNTYVIVTTPGTLTPPGGTATAATQGDWFLVSELTPGNYQWTFLNVGFDAPPATDTVAGIVELATNVETQTGTDATRAVTPASAAATYLPLSTLTAKGTLIAGQAASSPVALPVGTIGQVLQVDPTTTSGLKWATLPAASNGTVTQVSTGAGLSGGPITTVGTLDLVTQGISAGSYSNPSITVNTYGVITGISSGTSGIPCSCITAKGDLISGTAANTPATLTVGTDGQVLVACTTATSGLCWVTIPAALPATPTVAGTVLGCTTATNAALGCNALAANTTGTGNVAIGLNAFCTNTAGINNVYIGNCAGKSNTGSGSVGIGTAALLASTNAGRNVALGEAAACSNVTGECITAVGWNALSGTTGGCNTALGFCAGSNITTGARNVIIGPGAAAPSATGSCQLAIGFSATDNWIAGDSSKNVQFGAGIKDCTGSVGTAGQVLSSTGSRLQWATSSTGVPGWTSAGTVQSVGLQATTTSPVPGLTSFNNVSYRQLGPKEWEVAYIFSANGAWTNPGDGDYLFSLPNALQFNTSLPFQPVFQGFVMTAAQAARFYMLTGPSVASTSFSVGGNSSSFGAGPTIWDPTRFRLFSTDTGSSAPRAVSHVYWGGLSTTQWNFRFQFTAL